MRRDRNVPGDMFANIAEYAGSFMIRDGGHHSKSPFSTILSSKAAAAGGKEAMVLVQ